MDWERIERDVHSQAAALVGGGAASSLFFPSSSGAGRSRTSEASRAVAALTAAPSSPPTSQPSPYAPAGPNGALTETLLRELSDLRTTTQQQGKRMQIMEKMLQAFSEGLEGSNAAQFGCADRIDALEHEARVLAADRSAAARERAEMGIGHRTVVGRLQALEDLARKQEHEYASKDAFSQLLDNTVEQMTALSSVAANARQRSQQALTLTEALIQALHELNSGPSGFRLDFLASLSTSAGGGEQQRDQVVRLLVDALQQAIALSVRGQFGPAIECMSNLLRPQVEALRAQQDEQTEDLKTRIAALASSTTTRVDRHSEVLLRLEAAVRDADSRALAAGSDLMRVREQVVAGAAAIQGLREGLLAQHAATDALSTLQGVRSGAQWEGDRQAVRESLRGLQQTVEALSEGAHATRLDCDARLAELMRGAERSRSQHADQQRATERQLALLKGELSGLGLQQAAAQAEQERHAAEVYARLVEFDSVAASAREGAERAERAVVSAGPGPLSHSSTASFSSPLHSPSRLPPPSPASSSLTVPQELVSLREGLVNAAMDIDDLQRGHRELAAALQEQAAELERQAAASRDQGAPVQGRQLAAVKAGMDELQAELVALSDAVSSVQPALADAREQRARTEALRLEVAALARGLREREARDKEGGDRRAKKAAAVSFAPSAAPPAAAAAASSKRPPVPTPSKVRDLASSPAAGAKGKTAAASPSAAPAKGRKAAMPSFSSPSASKDKGDKADKDKGSKAKVAGPSVADIRRAAQGPPGKGAGAEAKSREAAVAAAESGSEIDGFASDSENGGEGAGGGGELDSDEEEEDEEQLEEEQEDELDSSFSEDDDDDDDDILGLEASPRERERTRTLQALLPLSASSPVPPSASATTAAAASTASSVVPSAAAFPPQPPAPPVLSGSLLGGRSGGGGARTAEPSRPLFASALVTGSQASEAAPKPPPGPSGPSGPSASSSTAALETAAAARRAMTAPAPKTATVQCTFCLRRVATQELAQHVQGCELRTEPCRLGCGATVRVVKMDTHMLTCPRR